MERLFDPPEKRPSERPPPDGPLAARLRPQTLDEFVGQEHLLGEGSALRAALESGSPHSMVLYGPPGTGKTTLARLAAEHADAAFEELSAVNAGRAEVIAFLAARAGGDARAAFNALELACATARRSGGAERPEVTLADAEDAMQ